MAKLLIFIIGAIAVYYLTNTFIVDGGIVVGDSMEPTFIPGDRYLMHKWAKYFRDPIRGDIVVIELPGRDSMIKRVIAIPGDNILISENDIYINDEKIEEPYLKEPNSTFCNSSFDELYKLKEMQYYVLGDNRKFSEDSRDFGPIRRSYIKAFVNKD